MEVPSTCRVDEQAQADKGLLLVRAVPTRTRTTTTTTIIIITTALVLLPPVTATAGELCRGRAQVRPRGH